MKRILGILLTVTLLVALLVPVIQYLHIPVNARELEVGQEVVDLRTQSTKTHYIGDGIYSTEAALWPVHYQDEGWQEIDNAWATATAPWNWEMTHDSYHAYALNQFTSGQIMKFELEGESVAFQPKDLQWTNDLSMIQSISIPQNVPVEVTNEPFELLTGMEGSIGSIRWNNAYGSGRHFEWDTTPGKLRTLLQLDAAPPEPLEYIINGGNPVMRQSFIFAPSTDLAIYVNGVAWDKKTKVQTVNDIEFRLDGETVWYLWQARYWDSTNSTGIATTVLRGVGNDLWLDVLVPYEWLQTAVYPIFIDPDTGAIYPGLGSTEDRDGKVAWSNPTQIQAEEGNAYCAVGLFTYSDWLRASQFGFSIPSNSTIDGVKVDIRKHAADTGCIRDSSLRLYNGSELGDEKVETPPTWPSTPAISTYGGATDDWNASLTPEIVNSASFGVRFSVSNSYPVPASAYVWYIKITVYYTEPPEAPTNVAATDGVHTDKVVVTWTKSVGATGYQVYRDGEGLGWLGDVATFDDMDADAPTITPGTASATDGTYTDKVTLSISGESANSGTTHTYKVRAKKDAGESEDSTTDTGYRSVGALAYQWYKSAADSDANYYSLSGATIDPYDDTDMPAPTITPGSTIASDGDSTAHVALSVSGESANVGEGRYYYCMLSATGATSQDTNHDRGYRGVGTLDFQWQRSSGDADEDYSNIDGATDSTYNDAEAPAPTITPGNATASDGTSTEYVTLTLTGQQGNDGDGRWFQCVLNAGGAVSQNSTADRGYRGTDTLSLQWRYSEDDIAYYDLAGATSDPWDDATAPNPTVNAGTADASDETSPDYVTMTLSGHSASNGTSWFYECYLTATDADPQYSTIDTGYKGTTTLSLQGQKSAVDSDADYSNITGATFTPYNDTEGVHGPDGRYYQWVVSMVGADSQNSTSDRGYKTEIIAPNVTVYNTTEISGISGILHGEILDIGYENANTIGFEWGLSTGNYTYNWTDTGSFGLGTFDHEIIELIPNTTYFWRAFAINTGGRGNSTALNFTTLALPLLPTNFTATAIGTSAVNLTWTMGAAANITVIRYSESKYPTSLTEGLPVYSGNSTWTTLEGLNLDTATYYFSAWSHNEFGYSLDYATTSIGGNMIAIAVVGLLSLVVMIFGFIYKPASIPMLLIAGVGWIVTGAIILDNNPLGSLNTPVAILAIMLALTCFIWIYATVWLPRRNQLSREDKDYQSYEEKVRKITGGK